MAARLSRFTRTPSTPSLPFKRSYHQSDPNYWIANHPVRVAGPIIWSIAAVGTVYFTCAAYDVYQDVKGYPESRRHGVDIKQLEANKARRRPSGDDGFPDVSQGIGSAWNSLSGPSKVLAAVTTTNTALLVLQKAPSHAVENWMFTHLCHIPAAGAFRYPQLLTSAFMHTGPLHLFMNTFVLFNFAPPLARSSTFDSSGSHLLAFFLSGAVLSALGSHVACRFPPNRAHRFRPGLGFSGVVSAVFAGWCMENPDGRVRVFPIPAEFTSAGMLQFSAVFEMLGVVGLWARLRLPLDVAFAAHLSGLAFGAAYVTYGRDGRFWKMSRRVAFRALKTAHVI